MELFRWSLTRLVMMMKINVSNIILITIAFIASGCVYSFTGGSVPEHIKTLFITPVEDNSGYGDPLYREELEIKVTEAFRSDNSFILSEGQGDAHLSIALSSINDSPTATGAGEIETERKITITCSVIYFDNIKQKEIFNKKITKYDVYLLEEVEINRNRAIFNAIEQVSEDILLAVVSGW